MNTNTCENSHGGRLRQDPPGEYYPYLTNQEQSSNQIQHGAVSCTSNAEPRLSTSADDHRNPPINGCRQSDMAYIDHNTYRGHKAKAPISGEARRKARAGHSRYRNAKCSSSDMMCALWPITLAGAATSPLWLPFYRFNYHDLRLERRTWLGGTPPSPQEKEPGYW